MNILIKNVLAAALLVPVGLFAQDQAERKAWDIIAAAIRGRGAAAQVALGLIGSIGGPESAGIQETILQSGDGQAVSNLAQGFSAAQCQKYLHFLTKDALDPSVQPKPFIIKAIAKAGTSEAAKALIEVANANEFPIAGIAFGSLRTIGSVSAPVLIPEIASGPDALHRETAVYVLSDLRLQAAVPAFAQALRDPDRAVRLAAALALAEIGSAEGESELREAAAGDNFRSEIVALAALAGLGQSQSEAKLRTILNDSQGPDRSAAPEAIASTKSPHSKALIYALGLDNNPQSSAIVAETILDPSDPRDLQTLSRDLQSQVPAIRLSAAERLLHSLSSPQSPLANEARGVISLSLESPDEAVRRAAVDFAAKNGSFLDALCRLIDSPDPEIKQAAIRAAGQRGQREDSAILKKYLFAEPPSISADAARALYAIDPSQAKEVFRDGLNSEITHVRIVCAALLLVASNHLEN